MLTGWSATLRGAWRPSSDTFFLISAPLICVSMDVVQREVGPGSSWRDFPLVPRRFFQLNDLQLLNLLVGLHTIKLHWGWII